MQRFPKVTLAVAGIIEDPKFVKEFQRIASQYGLDKNSFSWSKDKDSLIYLVSSSKLTIYPNVFDVFSLVILESLVCGTPASPLYIRSSRILMNTHRIPFVSIIICTYNRKKLLKSCLNSIYAQDYQKSNFEVIVVDGGSTDGTKELCREFPNIRFITESKHGLAHARNKGAELAKGAIIAYTDDDCIVDKNWLKNLIAGFRFSQKKIVGVGGPVHPLRPEIIPKKIHVKAALGLYDEGNRIKLVDGIITSNAAFKKEIFKNIKFDETLGVTRRGKLILCGEDTAFCQAIINSGYKLLYTPHAKVYHQINNERTKIPYVVKHALHRGITKTKIFLNQKQSRTWAIRYATSQLAQCLLKIPFDTSFTSCYNIIYSISTLCISLTGLDRIL